MGASYRVHVCFGLYRRHDPTRRWVTPCSLSHGAWELTSSRSGCIAKDRERNGWSGLE